MGLRYCKMENSTVITPASLGEQRVYYSTTLILEVPEVLVLDKYGHIHAHLCDVGVHYKSRNRAPGQLIWLS